MSRGNSVRSFFKSRFYERKLFFLRRYSAWLDKCYCLSHEVGLACYDASSENRSRRALAEIASVAKSRERSGTCPKIIWMYWNAPLQEAPEVVQLSVRSWREMNPDYEVKLLSDQTIEGQLGFDPFVAFGVCRVRLTIAMKTDVLRLYLLSRFGGVWADATVFCYQPLDTWMPSVVDSFGFYTFRHKTSPNRPIEAWLIAARQGDPVVRRVLELFVDHLFKKRRQALYVSNSRKSMERQGIGKNHPDRIYADAVRQAEHFGFVPYFTVGYFFNEAMREYLSPSQIERYFCQENRYAYGDDLVANIHDIVVSKETYKKNHQSSLPYKKRRDLLVDYLIGRREGSEGGDPHK